jgi:predicted outer membrane repeat protein
MKLKNFFIILAAFMLLMCCLSAVSAVTDDVMNATDSDVYSSDGLNYGDEQSINVEDDDSAPVVQENDDSNSIEIGPGNFADLSLAMKSYSEIILTGNITCDNPMPLDVIHNTIIYGNGYTIDANNLGRMFIVYPERNLTLINVRLINAYLPPSLENWFDGGAVLNMGTLRIVDCEFTNNYARDGGAIACDIGATTILEGTNLFYKNRVWQDGGAIANGGGSTLIITGKNTFESNEAYYKGPSAIPIDEGKGGAILNAFALEGNSSKKSYLYIEGETIFKDNIAYADGGAIFNHQAIANITGKNTFTGNIAVYSEGKGGAINNENATLYLDGTNLFQSNTAFRGGAIDNSLFESVMTIKGKNEFKSNRASMGGAISNQQGIRLNLYGENTFTDNHANFDSGPNIGGAIYSFRAYLDINGKNTFMKNSALGTGGAIYSANNNFMMNGNNIFDDNHAPMGGAILLIESQRVDFMGNNIFNGNSAETSGGAVMAITVNQFILSNHNYFTNNKAIQGGAIYTQNSVLDTQGSLFEGNLAGVNTNGYGGAIFLENTVSAIKYNIFKNNYASKTGPDIESYQSSIVSLDYNYWNSQGKPSQNQIHNYNVGNIGTWVILDLTIPSEIKQYEAIEVVRFKTNSHGNLQGEMPDYTVSVSPNFNPSNVVVTKNVGTSEYDGVFGRITVTASSSNFAASKEVFASVGDMKTYLNANNVVITDPSQTGHYEVTLTDANGPLSGRTISFTLDGEYYLSMTTNAQGKVEFFIYGGPLFENGCHELIATYAGGLYSRGSTATSIVACLFENQSSNKLAGNDIEMFYKDGTRYEVTLTDENGNPLANKDVAISINGGVYKRTTDANGKASIGINLNSGNYTIFAFTMDNDFVFCENNVYIKSTVLGEDIVKIYKNGTQYRAKFLDSKGQPLKNTEITFNINGVFYKKTTDANGIAQMNINLIPNTYIITATNTNGEKHSNTITVLPSIVENDDLEMYYKNGSQYSVRILGPDGKPVGANAEVKFNINGVIYKKTTDESGYAKLRINLSPGDYTITAEYNGLRASNNIRVKSVLFADDLVMKYGSKLNYWMVTEDHM